MKKIIILLVIVVLSVSFPGYASAFILMDFESPEFSRDTSPGDYAHTYTTSEGDVHFNGRIWHKVRGEQVGNPAGNTFLKNTGAEDVLIILFDFPVYSFEVDHFTYYDNQNYGVKMFGWDDSVIFEDEFEGSGVWLHESELFASNPLKKIELYSVNGNGNNFAIDNLKLCTVIPEPASMLLFGTGLFGLIGFRRKK